MKKPIWHSETKGSARETFIAFSAGRDVYSLPEADQVLVPYDIWTNQAHAVGLQKIGVYSLLELKKILEALVRLEQMWQEEKWKLNPALEDVHINIETFVSEQCGEELGGRLHSGRSRNDQIATDMKLYAREMLLHFVEEIGNLVDAVLKHARSRLETVMPGYTHHRKATMTTWAHGCAAYAQGLLRDAQRMIHIFDRINVCPLGAAASYGTTWPIDRQLVADLLAFDRVQENTLDAVNSRGEAEAEIACAVSFLMKRLAGISQDLILFSTEEFGFLTLPADFTTGSSIMPQKRNPDFAEAIKGKMHTVLGYTQALLGINSGNLSGYNKDIQWSKYLFLDVVREAFGSARILAEVFEDLIVNSEPMANAARSGFLNAVDVADFLARTRRLPFRTAYQLISTAVGSARENHFTLPELNNLLEQHKIPPLTEEEFQRLDDPKSCVAARDHLGSPHPQQVRQHLTRMGVERKEIKRWLLVKRKQIENAKIKIQKIIHSRSEKKR